MNMFNQKVYTAFWVWLGVLLIASGLLLILRIFMVSSTLFRGAYVKLFYNLNSLSRDGVSMDVSLALKMSWKLFFKMFFFFHFKKGILKNTSHGDFLLLTFLFDNMNSIVSREFVKKCDSEDWNDQFDKLTN